MQSTERMVMQGPKQYVMQETTAKGSQSTEQMVITNNNTKWCAIDRANVNAKAETIFQTSSSVKC